MELQAVKANGVKLAYRVSGDPESPPMVLLHALGEDGSDWVSATAVLARTHRVYAPDLRGHGRSAWPGLYSLELMREDVLAFLDAFHLDKITMIGHSMGAVVAYLVAESRPGAVAQLVLEEPAAPLPANPPRQVGEPPEGEQPFDWNVVAAMVEQRNHPDPAWWDDLSQVTARTLVIAGGPSSHLSQDEIRTLAHRIPGARLVTIDAGHEVHAARLADFLAAVDSFLP